MVIAAYAIGASEGYVYVPAEYPLAVERLRSRPGPGRERGLLGERHPRPGLRLPHTRQGGRRRLRLRRGDRPDGLASKAGAACRVRGRRSPPVEGLWGKPTNINNVETFANVPLDHQQRRRRLRRHGHRDDKGTKVFALAGNVANAGLIEVPMGITLRESSSTSAAAWRTAIIQGCPDRRPSGGCLPESLLDTPIDYETSSRPDAMMGSGGMVVIDDSTCMVDFARFFLQFTAEESCGKCVPCRVGTGGLVEILDAICAGKGELADLDRLERLARLVKASSLCGLGQTAPNPVLSSLKYFRDEFVEHIVAKRCRAVVCRDLVVYRIIPDLCTGCQRCVQVCPTGAITGPRAEVHNLDPDKCIKCRSCYEACHFGAIAGDAAAGEAVAGDAIVIESEGQHEH